MCTLIPTVYRALLKSALSGIGHRFTSLRKSILALEVRTHIEILGPEICNRWPTCSFIPESQGKRLN